MTNSNPKGVDETWWKASGSGIDAAKNGNKHLYIVAYADQERGLFPLGTKPGGFGCETAREFLHHERSSDPRTPWQWPEEHWRRLVARGRAGRKLRPSAWKDGARCAVALSFDSDHETSELRAGAKSISRTSWGQYGSRVGVPRILNLLRRYGVPASFYVPAVAALIHPEEQRRIIAEGHEIGLHGWIHGNIQSSAGPARP